MIDYYKILKLPRTAEAAQLRDALQKEMRLWMTRVNSPDLSARQEAERMVSNLEEAENILLDAERRQAYDRDLANKPADTERDGGENRESADGEWLEKGTACLIEGDIADALYFATQATEHDGKNADAWALLGQAKYRWGDHDDAIYEYRRAIKLRPNESSFYFDLASVFESKGDLESAQTNYERAATIEPDSTAYQAAVGQILVRQEEYARGIALLEECVKQDADNMAYRWLLANAYIDSSFEGWTYHEGDHYATSKQQVVNSLGLLAKAENLKVDDDETQHRVQMFRELLDSNIKRRFVGSIFTPILGGIVWLLIGGVGIVLGPLYYFASRAPQYAINKRAIGGEKTFDEAMSGSGLVGLAIGIAALPIMALVNLVRNYTGENRIVHTTDSPPETS